MHHSALIRMARDVAVHGDGVLAQLLRGLVGRGLVDVRDHDVRACSQEPPDDGCADACGCTRSRGGEVWSGGFGVCGLASSVPKVVPDCFPVQAPAASA